MTITSEPAGTDRAVLSFANLPAGATVLDSHSVVVPAGGINFRGTETFTVLLDKDHDVHQGLSVTATGKNDGSEEEVGGHVVQTIDLAYDVESPQADLTFASNNQNMWGDFPGYIGWHEYIPFLGGAPIVWNEATGVWDDAAAPDYWRSGEFSVIDIDLDSAQILAAASKAATAALAAAKAVFDVASVAVDTVALGIFNTARGALDTAWSVFNGTAYLVDWVAKGIYDLGEGAIAFARDVYEGLKALDFLGWGLAALNEAERLWDGVVSTYEAVKQAIYDTAKDIYEDAQHTLDIAKDVYDGVKQGIHDIALGVYTLAQNGVSQALAYVDDLVSFDSKLKLDAEVFAQVGLQVDFELDMGSVDTSVDYQLTSTPSTTRSPTCWPSPP